MVMGGVVAACSASCGSGDDGSAYRAGPGPLGGAALYGDFRAGRMLVLRQAELVVVSPADFRDRLATMEAAPGAVDGVFLHLPATGDALLGGTLVPASAIAEDLEPLYALRPTRLRYNFAVVSMPRDLDAFDDWSTAFANVTALSRVAREAGLVGIVVDDRSRAGLRVNHAHGLRLPTRTLEDYQAQSQLVGRKIMQAIVAGFPDAAVVVLRGADRAASAAPVDPASRDADSAQLLGSFFAGLVEGRGARSLLVDNALPDDATLYAGAQR